MKPYRYRPWFLAVAAVVFLVDQASKEIVRMTIPKGSSAPLLPGALFLTHTENVGAAFGLFPNATTLLVVTAFIACGLFLWIGRQGFDRRRLAVACGMMLGGAAGNLLDRLRFGAVTDFVDLRFWPVFNLADAALTCGALLLLWVGWRGEYVPRARSETQTPKGLGGGGNAPTETDDPR